MRVGQDLRQEALFSFPQAYLGSGDDVAEYAGFITDAATAYQDDSGVACAADAASCSDYSGDPPEWLQPVDATPPVRFPASSSAIPETLPTALGSTQEQLHSRGVYQDFLSDEVRQAIDCLNNGGSGDDCGVPGATTALEITPFFDVQLTLLSRWDESPQNAPIDVTNETVLSGNTHSRGRAAKMPDETGLSSVITTSSPDNLGLTATPGIDPAYASALATTTLYMAAESGSAEPEPPPGGTLVSGSLLSAVSGFKVSYVTVSGGDGAQCGQTDATYACTVPGVGTPTLTVSGMVKGSDSYYACASDPAVAVYSPGPGTTVFYLPIGQDLSGVSIVVQALSCSS